MTVFRRYVEENDWEGETWTFWLQVDGNEAGLDRLASLLADLDPSSQYDTEDSEESPYTLADEVEPEHVVDKLVEYSDTGYMASHTKVPGRLVLPEATVAETLHKGGIKDLFVA
ncbi:hypothetical protein GCM10022243_48940 [Saccharothrix violaceirubra]|uniref:Uncharacterized protein n=1 Tax=Saccharothrix violaceirubra TaxID=413306 RepID=A0A7W7SZI5_9PSEU|nr:hypothetical protein [Saccharothrix violaceirubra]MBB4963764.1 hypothetical protein [Saccharothrix violaceirubra]